MKTIKVTQYSDEIEGLQAVLDFNKLVIKNLDVVLAAIGGIEKTTNEVRDGYEKANAMLQQTTEEMQSLQLLYEAQILAGNYNEYLADNVESPPFMQLFPN